MMKQQARRSGAVMGFDTHMVARSRACSTRLTHPTITNKTSPHYAEALPSGSAGPLRGWRPASLRFSPTPAMADNRLRRREESCHGWTTPPSTTACSACPAGERRGNQIVKTFVRED
jgi:hypothetical protein